MQWLWCWRCKSDMPMLDEQEYAEMAALYPTCIRSVKSHRERTGASLKDQPVPVLFDPVRKRYAEMAGHEEPNENAIMHHRLLPYGPPCYRCGSPGARRRPKSAEAAWLRGRRDQTETLAYSRNSFTNGSSLATSSSMVPSKMSLPSLSIMKVVLGSVSPSGSGTIPPFAVS